jgi:hypothetical protein
MNYYLRGGVSLKNLPVRKYLSDDVVRKIFSDDGTHEEIGVRYGFSRKMVCDIRRGKTYSRITGKVYEERIRASPITYKEVNGCHVCTSHKPLSNGYILLWRKNKRMSIHRYVWEEARGIIPEGMCILHSCDNPLCINIGHFRLGTQRENMNDMMHKNRDKKFSKINDRAVLSLFLQDAVEFKLESIAWAKLLGISELYVKKICRGDELYNLRELERGESP